MADERISSETPAKTSSGMDLFRIAGIQISIDYSWLVIFALVLWSLSAGYFPHQYPGYGWGMYLAVGLVATLLFFASVLIHELSHATVGNAMGEEVRKISLFIFGGMAHLSGEPKSPKAEFRIAAVGPLTSIALGGVFWLIQRGCAAVGVGELWVATFGYLALINVALAVFNLLPGFPLDGGRLLRAYFWRQSGSLQKATARAADWGKGIAIGLMLLGGLEIFGGALVGGLWLIFIGMFLRGAAQASYYGVVVEHALGRTHVRDIMVREPNTIDADATVAEAVENHFLRDGYGGFPVTRDGRVSGIVSLSMIRHCPAEERATKRVGEVMHPLDDTVRIPPTATVSEALRRMVEADMGRLLVMDDGQFLGLITRTGITRYVQLKTQLEASH